MLATGRVPVMLLPSVQLKSERQAGMLNQAADSFSKADICLTLAKAIEGNVDGSVRVPASRLLAYYQQMGFTRLKLIGGIILEVKESTEQIDRLVRDAATHGNPALQ